MPLPAAVEVTCMPEQSSRTYEISGAALVAGVLAILIPVCLLAVAYGTTLGRAGPMKPGATKSPAFRAPRPAPRHAFPSIPDPAERRRQST